MKSLQQDLESLPNVLILTYLPLLETRHLPRLQRKHS